MSYVSMFLSFVVYRFRVNTILFATYYWLCLMRQIYAILIIRYILLKKVVKTRLAY